MEAAASPRLPPGTKVKVELDVEPVDKYGRQLAYLYRRTVVNQPGYAWDPIRGKELGLR